MKNGSILPSAFAAACALILVGSTAFADHRDRGGDREARRRCHQSCGETAMEAKAACREDGGNFFECRRAYSDAMEECVAECMADGGGDEGAGDDGGDADGGDADGGDADGGDADGGDDRHEPCGIECFKEARAVVSQCREEGGSFWECVRAYRDEVRACREAAACPVRERRERPAPCGAECFSAGREAFQACREAQDGDDGGDEGGGDEGGGDEGGGDEGGGDEDPAAGEGDAGEGGGAHRRRRHRGDLAECVAAFIEAVKTCREEAGCNGSEEEDEAEEDEAIEELVAEAAEFLRGDVNDDASLNISDAVNLLSFLFLAGVEPPCLDAADANDDGQINVSDPSAILNSLFTGTGPLPAPALDQGVDPTPDSLGCGIDL